MKKEWERLEPIRIRIMSEAYDLADRGDSEGCNSVKVMCSDVLALIETEIATERNALDLQTTIERGTKAWADTPDDWVDELRGGAEPVGYVSESGKGAYLLVGVGLEDDTPLYAAPPKREWVGLTVDEIDKFMPYCHSNQDLSEFRTFAFEIEAKLKEKNHGSMV
jgi:hypothetical protein